MPRSARTPFPVAVAAALVVVGAVVLGTRVALARQAAIARRRIGKPLGDAAPTADRVWRAGLGGTPLELLLLGDSIATGLGAQHRKETLGGRLAKGLAGELDRPVRLRTGAVVGAESADLAGQIDALPADYRADAAVIIVGGNDVTHRVPVAVAAAHLAEAIRRLRAVGTAVVVGTCPDLGALRAVPQPLRSIGSRASQQLATAQADRARAEGAGVVSLRRAVGPFFRIDPDGMFSLDRFHPSALGYRRTAEALLPVVRDAITRGGADAATGRRIPPAAPRPRSAPTATAG
ncbi:SGNH/GDSL hydrolase family protein [Microbacterium sp. KSW4-11]|uniref:SGNH/GDSL hydrolase family protein n=1 Tax=Microbacterium gawkjiense TaxID=3067309 RepID=A0ABU3GDC9_9MICO|nr:SGNH/GDSL hydrolase family protein [Microbacterium sp. KSW4-11]MDT3317496.1 SGNH/GDSL hydrolase family protein [Microbacterium sp. KSW4-11]